MQKYHKYKPILTCKPWISGIFPECIFLRICTSEDYKSAYCNFLEVSFVNNLHTIFILKHLYFHLEMIPVFRRNVQSTEESDFLRTIKTLSISGWQKKIQSWFLTILQLSSSTWGHLEGKTNKYALLFMVHSWIKSTAAHITIKSILEFIC